MATGNSEPFFNNMQNLNAAGVGAFTFNLRFPGQYYDPNSVTLATAPGIPTIGTAIAGNGQASVAFTPPTSNGGSSITNYTATSNPGGLTGTGLTSPILVTGLTNGTAYTFTITATNAVGTSLPSSASNSIIPAISTVFYIHTDQLDTPRQITDSNGNLVWQWDNSDPFGNNVANQNPSGQGTFSFNLRFPGQYYDQENNTHYNINRDYDPSIGRYIQSDPIGLAGGSFSTYIYVGNNPISFIDPLGLHTTVVINNNDPLIGTHAGVVIGSGNSSAL
jgi:RHS repeat-associated protein